MSKQLIIGFGYKKQVGKNEASIFAQTYLKHLGQPTIIDYFAKPIKEGICKEVYGLSEEQYDGSLKEIVDPFWQLTPRQIMQFIGTDIFRNRVDKDIWIKSLERRIINNLSKNIIISDVRFINEAAMIKKYNGCLVRIDRDNDLHDNHQSEVDLNDFNGWDYIIKNNGSLEELNSNVCEIVAPLSQH